MLCLLSSPLPISCHQHGHSYNTFVQTENPLQKDAAWENRAATILFSSLPPSVKMSATQGHISSTRFSLLQIQTIIPQLDPHGWLCKLKWGLEVWAAGSSVAVLPLQDTVLALAVSPDPGRAARVAMLGALRLPRPPGSCSPAQPRLLVPIVLK